MRVLYTESNVIDVYCKAEYIVPLVIICIISFILALYLQDNHEIIGIISVIIGIISIIFIFVCVCYTKPHGYKYYVALENNEEIDLDKYNIKEQKGDLYIITDK